MIRPETHALAFMGAVPQGAETVLLLGPREPGFWAHFTAQPEYADGAPDPMDRWSKRAIGALAADWGGTALFPSDGPPYPPFLSWALETGRAFVSPVGMLVHAEAGLWISFRGAVRVSKEAAARLAPPGPAENPCKACIAKPCLSACPIGALSGDAPYDVPACRAYLARPEGAECMGSGCAVRRACPVGQSHGRLPAQSAFHMKAFR